MRPDHDLVVPVESRSALSPAERILWVIERDPVLRSTVTVVSELDRAPEMSRLRARLRGAQRRIPRLVQRVEEPLFGPPRWAAAPDVDMDFHLRHTNLGGHGSVEDVMELAAVWAMAGFDRSRPLWEFTVVDGLAGGRSAFVQKVHHSVTDGVGGMRLAMELLDTSRHDRHRSGSDEADAPAPGHADLLARARSAVRSGMHPVSLAASGLDTARWGLRLVAPATSPLSPVMVGRGTVLRFTALELPLAAVRDRARAWGGSVNDVFLSAVAGGLYRYHREHGVSVEELRMNLPISTRSAGDAPGGNRFVPARFVVPVSDSDSEERARRIGQLARQWRSPRALALADALALGLSQLPPPLLTGVFGSMLRNVDFAATNVPGIPVPVFLAGALVERQYAFAPPSGAALNISLVSHDQTCCVGVNVDHRAVPDPALLRSCLRQAFEQAVGARTTRAVA